MSKRNSLFRDGLASNALQTAALAALLLSAQQALAQAPPAASAKAARYLSLKADRVSLREGPGGEFPILWVFQRAGLPVEVVRENDMWLQVRDSSGAVCWVHGSLLSRRRTAIVLAWEMKDGKSATVSATLREDDSASATAIAQVEAGALVSIIGCEKNWCRISIGGFRGYVEQDKLWGTYPSELIK
jgi:SH3-like domain-containing protein